MKVKGVINWRKLVFRTTQGDFEAEKIPTEPRFWIAEVKGNKVVRFIRPYIPRRLRECKGNKLLRASIPGIYGAPMAYHAFRCYYCGGYVDRDALKISVIGEDIELCYNCAEKIFGEDYPTVIPTTDGNFWLGAPQPADAIVPLADALTLREEAGGLINIGSAENAYIIARRFGDVEIKRIPEKYRSLLMQVIQDKK